MLADQFDIHQTCFDSTIGTAAYGAPFEGKDDRRAICQRRQPASGSQIQSAMSVANRMGGVRMSPTFMYWPHVIR